MTETEFYAPMQPIGRLMADYCEAKTLALELQVDPLIVQAAEVFRQQFENCATWARFDDDLFNQCMRLAMRREWLGLVEVDTHTTFAREDLRSCIRRGHWDVQQLAWNSETSEAYGESIADTLTQIWFDSGASEHAPESGGNNAVLRLYAAVMLFGYWTWAQI